MTDLAETLKELGIAQAKLMHRNDLLRDALERLGHGENSGCAIEDCVGCAALLAAQAAAQSGAER
ncbi:hypothetical protein LCGC14_1709380 [marine sediment metagenome]|uniref:Uncharacterized protein n=1 Tax=marine sediment metagenome TaxID=412755 RepID=A0A0F9I384_9ZZZZ